jgi:hypothetical protein
MSGGRFLERWSRLKKIAEKTANEPIPDGEALLAQLGPDSDFGQFLRQEISAEVRSKAMKTLFADPHFNVMDGLDIYIDDYSISEPIPEAMLATLRHMQTLTEETLPEDAPLPAPAADCDNLAEAGQNVPIESPPPSAESNNQ